MRQILAGIPNANHLKASVFHAYICIHFHKDFEYNAMAKHKIKTIQNIYAYCMQGTIINVLCVLLHSALETRVE